MKKEIKVYIGLSGGIDSAVAAALLQKQGYNCTGVFIRFIDNEDTKLGLKNAANITNKLNIPLKIYDFRKEFEQKIIKYFIQEYRYGRTPNPCIVCNYEMKFGLFLKKALKEGTDFISTGHYVRKVYNSKDNKFRLLKGLDNKKDQSYFLYRLNQNQLKHSLFPIGTYTKQYVIDLSKDLGLNFENTTESQEICFIKDNNIFNFLQTYIKPTKGDIFTISGEKIGEHDGFFKYTIGQRSGIGIGGGTPYFVVKIESETNTIMVSDNEKDLFKKSITLTQNSWISGTKPDLPLKCEVAIRYTHNPQGALLTRYQNDYKIIFYKKQRAPTPGQSAVIYKEHECLGGGIIS